MKPWVCILCSVACIALAALASWSSNHPGVDVILWKGAGHLLSKSSDWLGSGAVAFVALSFYAGAKVVTEERVRARERETMRALIEIHERISSARDGVTALARIQTQTNANLCHDGITPFSNIASFCASWIQPKRHRWCDKTMLSLLTSANNALFSFVVALEVQQKVANSNLPSLAAAAGKALDEVEAEIRKRG